LAAPKFVAGEVPKGGVPAFIGRPAAEITHGGQLHIVGVGVTPVNTRRAASPESAGGQVWLQR
jgi:hypothetical protein